MIVVKISDGLGNQLFQYAYARMLSTRTKQKVYLDNSDVNRISDRTMKEGKQVRLCDIREYQLNNFQITLPVINKELLYKIYHSPKSDLKFYAYCRNLHLSHTIYLKESMVNEEKFRFSRWQNYYITGYFFDKKHYETQCNLLRKELRLKEKIKIPKEVKKILTDRNTVSVHIRRGDFLKFRRDMSQSNYYNLALDYIKHKVHNPVLLIFSDDVNWVKDNMKFDFEHVVISGQGFSDCEELTLMSMCKNNIIANSTFSYWGAWLNEHKDKMVISPRGWNRKAIPDTWIQL